MMSNRANLVVLAAATAVLSGCVVAPYPRRAVVYAPPPAYENSPPEVYVDIPPPAPYVEVIPVLPFAGAVWIGGYWGWRSGRHHWVPGRYEAPRPGYGWSPHRWHHAPRGGWYLRGGGWVRR